MESQPRLITRPMTRVSRDNPKKLGVGGSSVFAQPM